MTLDKIYKTGLAINYWDDPQGLLRILQSKIYDFVNVVILIDGRYKGRKDKEENDPELMDLIRRNYNKIHYVKMKDAKQIDKRNRYLEIAEELNLDFIIICDSDHVIEIDPEEFQKGLYLIRDSEETNCFPIAYNNMGVEKKTIKIFKGPFTYRHRQNKGPNISHSQLFGNYGKDNIELLGQFSIWQNGDVHRCVRGIKMYHDKTFRTKKRLDWDYVYYRNNPTR